MDLFGGVMALFKMNFENFFRFQEGIEEDTIKMLKPFTDTTLLQKLSNAHKDVHVSFLDLCDTGITKNFNPDDHNWVKVIIKHINEEGPIKGGQGTIEEL